MVAAVERQLGPVNLLVNNAGIALAWGLAVEVGEEESWREMEVKSARPISLRPCCLAQYDSAATGAHHQRSESWRFVRP